MNNKFVLSSKEFGSIKEAEQKVKGWHGSGNLKEGTKLYRIVEIYDIELKFVKRKK